MVFAAHFGLVGLLGYTNISESENSFVSSLTFNGPGGEEDFPTSTGAKGSS